MSCKKRLMLGIRRLNRIIKSSQTYDIPELLNQAKLKAQKVHDIDEDRRKTKVLRRAPINSEQRTEQNLLLLHAKIDTVVSMLKLCL